MHLLFFSRIQFSESFCNKSLVHIALEVVILKHELVAFHQVLIVRMATTMTLLQRTMAYIGGYACELEIHIGWFQSIWFEQDDKCSIYTTDSIVCQIVSDLTENKFMDFMCLITVITSDDHKNGILLPRICHRHESVGRRGCYAVRISSQLIVNDPYIDMQFLWCISGAPFTNMD